MSGGKGLADFLEIFRSVMRKVNKGNYRDRDFASVSNMILAGTTHLELKMGIDKVKKDGIHRAIRDIERAFLQEEKTNPRTKNGMLHFPTSIHSEELQGFRENVRNPHNTDRQYQFSLHFSRKSNGKYTNKTGFRYEKERKDIWKDIELLRKFYTSHHISHCPLPEIYKGPTKESEFIHLLSKEYINIADLIASIDAAGAEIYSPPEIFAHQIRYTRDEESYFKKGCARNEIIPINRPKRLAISYHAGEDFGHILTGMRRIDECVRFMDFGVGDRIGHALAMGICPKKWMEENPRITLSQEEYFDNLVWLYGILQEIIPHYREALAHAQYIKTILENCSFGPSWICNPLSKAGLRTWSTFFRAWELRRYCPTRTIQDSSFSFLSYSEQEKIRKIRQEEKEAWEIYCEYSSTLPYSLNNEYTFPPVSLQYQKGESFGYEKSNEYHEIGRLEIEAYSIVQDYLLGQYSDRGIVFETNPSSNKVIGGLGKYENHPIFRWFPPQEELLLNGAKYNPFGLRKGRMQVCINTDDPGIFPTTIQNEHTLLCRAAQKITNNHYIANKWIDEIREIGVRAFLVNRGHRGAL